MKKRLDVLLFEKGMVPSRERAKAIIMSGIVYVNNQKADKAGMSIPEDAEIEIRGKTNSFVSRGGLKIEKALNYFQIDPKDLCVMDIGASTGGFTDCMLQNGAEKVYAVDVGYGQLAWKLRSDDRVVSLERTNFRYATAEQIDLPLDFASVDVSFISLTLILPVLYGFMREGGEAVCLIKPQFEAGREKVGKKGVVRDKAVHLEVVKKITGFALEQGFSVLHLTFSPIKGPEGNIEYLCHLAKNGEGRYTAETPEAVVAVSHAALDTAGKTESE